MSLNRDSKKNKFVLNNHSSFFFFKTLEEEGDGGGTKNGLKPQRTRAQEINSLNIVVRALRIALVPTPTFPTNAKFLSSLLSSFWGMLLKEVWINYVYYRCVKKFSHKGSRHLNRRHRAFFEFFRSKNENRKKLEKYPKAHSPMRDSVPQSRELTDRWVSCRHEWADVAGGGLGI